jgi:hypothetical protein
LINFFSYIESRQHSAADDCIVLSSGSESEIEEEEDDNTQSNYSPVPITPLSNDLFNPNSNTDERRINPTSQSPTSIHSFQSLIRPNADDDGGYWEDIARITYDLMSDTNEQSLTRKRSNSSSSSLLSNNDEHHHRKRLKQSNNKQRTSDIEIITLSSNDSSDNDDQLS